MFYVLVGASELVSDTKHCIFCVHGDVYDEEPVTYIA